MLALLGEQLNKRRAYRLELAREQTRRAEVEHRREALVWRELDHEQHTDRGPTVVTPLLRLPGWRPDPGAPSGRVVLVAVWPPTAHVGCSAVIAAAGADQLMTFTVWGCPASLGEAWALDSAVPSSRRRRRR